jgi:hypothetical protein
VVLHPPSTNTAIIPTVSVAAFRGSIRMSSALLIVQELV